MRPAPIQPEILDGSLPLITPMRAATERGHVLQVSRDGRRAVIHPTLLAGYVRGKGGMVKGEAANA